MNSKGGVASITDSRKPYFEFREISKSFGTNIVLEGASLHMMPGKTTCILGRSGVGKSVCLRLIMGFLKPDGGRVIAAGEDITDYQEQELERVRKKVTMVFQEGALFDSLTVAENVAFPLRERGQLDESQIQQIVDGLLDLVGVSCAKRDLATPQISMGMRRSVAIARALAAQPEAVLYDEPTTMVDPLMARRLADLIQRLKAHLKLTGVVVTHDMRLAEKVADHVIFLDHAKVIFAGTPEEMGRSTEPVVQRFLELDRTVLKIAEGERRLAG